MSGGEIRWLPKPLVAIGEGLISWFAPRGCQSKTGCQDEFVLVGALFGGLKSREAQAPLPERPQSMEAFGYLVRLAKGETEMRRLGSADPDGVGLRGYWVQELSRVIDAARSGHDVVIAGHSGTLKTEMAIPLVQQALAGGGSSVAVSDTQGYSWGGVRVLREELSKIDATYLIVDEAGALTDMEGAAEALAEWKAAKPGRVIILVGGGHRAVEVQAQTMRGLLGAYGETAVAVSLSPKPLSARQVFDWLFDPAATEGMLATGNRSLRPVGEVRWSLAERVRLALKIADSGLAVPIFVSLVRDNLFGSVRRGASFEDAIRGVGDRVAGLLRDLSNQPGIMEYRRIAGESVPIDPLRGVPHYVGLLGGGGEGGVPAAVAGGAEIVGAPPARLGLGERARSAARAVRRVFVRTRGIGERK